MREKSNNLSDRHRNIPPDCSVCRDLLANTKRFFELLQNARESHTPDWLTVDEVAGELKISRTIVYRLIRHGELEAVNIVETDGRIAQRGHYRIRRSSLNNYLESKKVRPFSEEPSQRLKCKRFPDVKNHLGL
jgi:excisionase family DNA binding protein